MTTLKELISNKVNEAIYEYQQANNITSGDIDPIDALELEGAEDALCEIIEKICAKQPREINFDNLAPSWYIYTDYEGIAHSETFGGIGIDQFFTKVSKKIAFDDLDDITMQKIYYKGKEVYYVGWQPCMKFEYKDLDGNTIWVGYFEEWDH